MTTKQYYICHSRFKVYIFKARLYITMSKTRIFSQIVDEKCYFLKYFLNISYYFCLSRFHYLFDNVHFISSSWLPQKFCCALSSHIVKSAGIWGVESLYSKCNYTEITRILFTTYASFCVQFSK